MRKLYESNAKVGTFVVTTENGSYDHMRAKTTADHRHVGT